LDIVCADDAATQYPRKIEYISALPIGNTGKVQRSLLRKRELEQAAQATQAKL
jgi:acyl-coenzyme A synthetase/AMP-(fatty) acid ligase